MSRRVQAVKGEAGVVLPDGWVLDGEDIVVVSDDTWARVTADAETLGRLLDLGFTTDVPDPVPTWRDIQQATLNAPNSTGLQSEIDAVNAELGAHEAATTNVHGIADTALLETKAGAQAKADQAEADANLHTDQHAAQTDNVHGIADTSKLGWNENVDVVGSLDGQVLTKVSGTWKGAAPPLTDLYEATFNFATATDAWVVAHNQNTYALSVETFDNNDQPIDGNVRYLDPNTVQIEYYIPMTGYARVWGQ